MEDKVFDLMAQLYNEIKDIRANMATKEDLNLMATKEDLLGMASKSDIANMATKEDLKSMATKEDLLGMASKSDIANMATKEDLKSVATKNDLLAMATKDDIRRLEGEIFRFENESKNKFDALFDGYKQNTEAIHELRRDVKDLKSVVEQHEVKLKIVK